MISQAVSFSFEAYRIEPDRRTVTFLYSQGFEGGREVQLQSKVILPGTIPNDIPSKLLDSILHSLHIMLGISYWKMYCSKEIRIKTRPLSQLQAQFWNTVYTKGLGEFYYKNQIDFGELVSFPYDNAVNNEGVRFEPKKRALVGVAGGKDSLVAVELLKKADMEAAAIVIETNHKYALIHTLLEHISLPALFVRRELDEKMKALNETGLVFNGHIPVSAVYAFIMLLTAAVNNYKYIIVSNEKSANIGNVQYNNMEINHQWSKSEEFEMLFRSYVSSHITPDISYFSLLRPFTEIKIVELFSKYKRYFPFFSSCNKNFTVFKKTAGQKWCGQCPKCAFTFAMLSAFLTKKEVTGIFNKNLFEDERLVPLYRQLLGIEAVKPFDCVGTFEEVVVAFSMAHKKGEYGQTPVMNMFEKLVLPDISDITNLERYVFRMGEKDTLPEAFRSII